MISKCIALVILARLSYAYPSGAPAAVCASLKPSHGSGVFGQTSPSPYTISLSAPVYTCGEEITVTLGGSTQFEGFLCQARPVAKVYATSGNLTASGSVAMKNPCGVNAALTHTEKSRKSTAVFKWTPPPTGRTDVSIVCTFVQEKALYWESQVSTVLKYNSKCSGASQITASLLPTILCIFVCIISAFRKN